MKQAAIIISLLFYIVLAGNKPVEFNYLPSAVGENQIISYSQFTLSYNEQHEQADWVAYELSYDEVKMKQERCDCFKADKNIESKSASKSDYRSTGFDLGHLSPAADNNLSPLANEESFFMSNISPQIPSFNRGIWKELEEWVRTKALEYNSVYVITGPVFVNNLGKIGKNEVTIPGYYYKVLLRNDSNTIKSVAFLIPHLAYSNNIKDFIVPVNTVETITGIDFFPHLDNSIENRIESQYQPGNWGF